VRRSVLVVLLLCGPFGVQVGIALASPPSFPAEMRDTAALLLRLTDLGPGYTIGDDSGCGIGTENAPENLAQAVITHLPENCSIEFEHRRPSPYVESSAMTFHTPDGPATFFALRSEWLKYWSGIEKAAVDRPQSGIGDEARLLLIPNDYIPGGSKRKRKGAVVFWRRGMTLGSLHVAGPRKDRATRMAVRLAARQDERIRMPTPLGPRDNDDVEVPLSDPRIDVPVQWLGRHFAPGRGLPRLRLAYTYGPERPDPEQNYPNPRARLEYEGGRGFLVLDLDAWRPADWHRVSRSLSARQLWKTPCARGKRISLARGHAIVYAGYARLPRSGRCPTGSRNSFAALVFFRRVVVAVNMPYCDRCAEGVTGRRAPYNSMKGMTAVVRALRQHRR
jgi:hypothetical protein